MASRLDHNGAASHALDARARRARAIGPRGIVAAMAVAIVACGTVAFVDERRETAASRIDFAREQTTLAKGVALALTSRLRELPHEPVEALREVVGPVEEAGSVVFMANADGAMTGTSGATVQSPRIGDAIRDRRCLDGHAELAPCSLRLSHEESVAVGLPPRTSVAAFASFIGAGGEKRWVVIATTARRNSDREERASARLAIAFVFSSVLVLTFGTIALQTQQRQLELARDLAIADAVRDRDERLGRADKMAALGAMATGIAHQVATPLSVILARVEQLFDKVQGDERAQRAVVVIGEQTRRIEGIVRAFLGIARGGAPAALHVEPTALAKAAIDFVDHRFTEAGVKLTLSMSDALPTVACDPKLMEQGLVNLLLNACDACTEGGHVELAVSSAEGLVTFTVTDDGEGITPDVAARALDPFFTTKADGRGSGLGLTIANEIVAHHHGKLSIAPREDGRGTRASIELRRIKEDAHG